jgi:hypothetical protein
LGEGLSEREGHLLHPLPEETPEEIPESELERERGRIRLG